MHVKRGDCDVLHSTIIIVDPPTIYAMQTARCLKFKLTHVTLTPKIAQPRRLCDDDDIKWIESKTFTVISNNFTSLQQSYDDDYMLDYERDKARDRRD